MKPGNIGDIDDGYDSEGMLGAVGGIGERTPKWEIPTSGGERMRSELTECSSENLFLKLRIIGDVDNEYNSEGMSGGVSGVSEGMPVWGS